MPHSPADDSLRPAAKNASTAPYCSFDPKSCFAKPSARMTVIVAFNNAKKTNGLAICYKLLRHLERNEASATKAGKRIRSLRLHEPHFFDKACRSVLDTLHFLAQFGHVRLESVSRLVRSQEQRDIFERKDAGAIAARDPEQGGAISLCVNRHDD